MTTEEAVKYEAEHPGVERMRLAFEATFGDMAGVMRAMNHWHNTRNEWNDPWNRDREKPITEVDVEAALQAAFAAVRAVPTADTSRLDWLDQQGEAYGFEGEHHGNRWVLDGPFRSARVAIDSEMVAHSKTFPSPV